MPPVKHAKIRSAQRWTKPESAPTLRRGRGNWVVRWIGAAKRRFPKQLAAAAIEVPCARIIQLSWADTFGRPARLAPAGVVVRLLPV
ncbi:MULTISPECIES: hypothetical protein [unclassified Methylobacterium]|uniref:hypothetical protein n=1 Tax=unclassified Methylobacterium TaxID=2615210 RepID=UPI0022698F96|nr:MULTISPECIES: hypothetical protein [unclassified Methylobacterium]